MQCTVVIAGGWGHWEPFLLPTAGGQQMPGARGWAILSSQAVHLLLLSISSEISDKTPADTELLASVIFHGIHQDDGALQTIAQRKGKHQLNKIRLPEI